jgi:fibronectin type 3 domain-containing protein
MQTPPVTVGKLTTYDQVDDKFSVSWVQVGPTSSVNYEVFVKQDSEKDFIKMGETKENNYTIKTTLGGRKYQIKVRAKNNCGPGLYSPT